MVMQAAEEPHRRSPVAVLTGRLDGCAAAQRADGRVAFDTRHDASTPVTIGSGVSLPCALTSHSCARSWWLCGTYAVERAAQSSHDVEDAGGTLGTSWFAPRESSKAVAPWIRIERTAYNQPIQRGSHRQTDAIDNGAFVTDQAPNSIPRRPRLSTA